MKKTTKKDLAIYAFGLNMRRTTWATLMGWLERHGYLGYGWAGARPLGQERVETWAVSGELDWDSKAS
jgi:hypothetical protein